MPGKNQNLTCPCGGAAYASCCQPFHKGVATAPTAEALMRSRYSAYALGLTDYVSATWHATTRPAALDLSADQQQGKWLGLTVKSHRPDGDKAEVEFIARFKPNQGPASRLHESSRFVREEGRWYYTDGDLF